MDEQLKAWLKQLLNCTNSQELATFLDKEGSLFNSFSESSQEPAEFNLIVTGLADLVQQWENLKKQALYYQSQKDKLNCLTQKLDQKRKALDEEQDNLSIQARKNTIVYLEIINAYNQSLRAKKETNPTYLYNPKEPLLPVEEYQGFLMEEINHVLKIQAKIQFTQSNNALEDAINQCQQRFNIKISLEKIPALKAIFTDSQGTRGFLIQLKNLHTKVAASYYDRQIQALRIKQALVHKEIYKPKLFRLFTSLETLQHQEKTFSDTIKSLQQQQRTLPPIVGEMPQNLAIGKQAEMLLRRLEIDLACTDDDKILVETLGLAIDKYHALQKIYQSFTAKKDLEEEFTKQYSSFSPDNFILSSEELINFIAFINTKDCKQQLTNRQTELTKCSDYIKANKILNVSKVNQKKLAKTVSKLEQQQQILEDNLNSDEFKNYAFDISQIEQSIEQQLIQLKTLEVFTDDPTKPIAHINNLEQWQQDIDTLYHLLPEDLQNWYKQWQHILNKQIPIDIKCSYQAQQLLRDICFEMQYGRTNNDYPVLRKYQATCPEPLNDWPRLLETRLPVEVGLKDFSTLPLINNLKITQILTKLKKIQTELPTNSRQALLLEQLWTNLYHGCRLIQNDELADLKWLETFNDPRYDILYQHSDVIHKWVAEIVKCFATLLAIKIEKNPYGFWHRAQHSVSGQALIETQIALRELSVPS